MYKQEQEDQYKDKLSELAFRVTRLKHTENPGSSDLLNNKTKGTYTCVCCGKSLFSSEHKFDSGTGWPSFFNVNEDNISRNPEHMDNLTVNEVVCSGCDAHLGHEFYDGPKDKGGKRFCINGVALSFNAIDSDIE